MTETARALYEFYSGFGIPAYTVGTIPDDAVLPYITYSVPETDFLQPATHYAQVWYRSTSNVELLEKVDEIKHAITYAGTLLPCEGGSVCIRPDTPFVQLQTDEDPAIRFAYLNLQLTNYHM